MAVETARRGAEGRAIVKWARVHILCREHTARTLARALGVSPATVARTLSALRAELAREGCTLVSVKEGRRWHYEIRPKPGVDPWKDDPFIRGIGSVKGKGPPPGVSEDDELYGPIRRRR